MAHWKDNLLLKVANVLAYSFFLGSNVYGALGPANAHYGAGAKDTYITPEQWIFIVWPVIHLLLLGMIVYQFFEHGHHLVVEGIGWRFPVLCILNAVYANLYTHHGRGYAIAAFVVMLFVAGTVSHIYRSLKVQFTPRNLLDTLFVHLPFSLYHGFVVVLLYVSGFAAFGVDAHTHKAGIITKVLVFLALLFLESVCSGYVFYGEGDVAGALVISLSLLAIFQHQTSSRFIHYSALAFFIISAIAVLRAVIAAFNGRHSGAVADEERAPLVG